jgi:hypothetical protein
MSARPPILAAAALAGALLLAPVPARAQSYVAAGAPGAWSDFTTMTIRVADRAGAGTRSDWSFERLGPGGDLSILGRTSDGRTNARVEMLLVNERAWLVKGAALPPDGEIDLLDGAALTLQLVLRLLELAHPGGPASLGGEVAVERKTNPEGLRVATPSMSGAFGPPSTLSGVLKPAGPDGVAYRLAFDHGVGPARQAEAFTGTWGRLSRPRTLEDRADVSTFALYELGPRAVPSGIVTIMGYGAIERPSAPTIAEVRRRYPRLP